MPILDVRIVGPVQANKDNLARYMADAAAEVFKSGPQGTWVTVQAIQASDYAENAGGPPEGVFPVFVSVIKKKTPEGDDLDRETKALTAAVAQVCGRPVSCVHVIYEPDASGRLSFGGRGVR